MAFVLVFVHIPNFNWVRGYSASSLWVMLFMMPEKQHILLIDDDAATCRLFGGKLGQAGYEVLYAHEGNTGREMARRYKPNLILLDVNLPGTDGLEIARRLRDDEETKHIPIALLTNQDLSVDAERAVKEAWISDYIHKGTDLDEFVERVQKLVPPETSAEKPDLVG